MISFSDTTIFSIRSFRIIALGSCKAEKSHRRCVYHQFCRNCISPKRSFVYHHCERLYNLRLMIYAFSDDIHTKVWWNTIAFAMDKKRQSEDCLFWSWKRDSNTRPAHYEWAALPTELFQQLLYASSIIYNCLEFFKRENLKCVIRNA